jgi:hypothetical protein
MDRIQIINAICSATALIGVFAYFQFQISKVNKTLSEQKEKIEALEKHLQAQDYAIRQMMDALGGPEALAQAPERRPKRLSNPATTPSPKRKVSFKEENEEDEKERLMREEMGISDDDDDISDELQDLDK